MLEQDDPLGFTCFLIQNISGCLIKHINSGFICFRPEIFQEIGVNHQRSSVVKNSPSGMFNWAVLLR